MIINNIFLRIYDITSLITIRPAVKDPGYPVTFHVLRPLRVWKQCIINTKTRNRKIIHDICLSFIKNTIAHAGQKEYKWVTVYLKQEELILSFKKKYLGGALTTSKECMIQPKS